MSQLSQLSPKEKAQTGIYLIKAAIGQVLSENRNTWVGRYQIEECLGLGAVASLLLEELAKDGDIIARREAEGGRMVYQAAG